jgi:hypothetical protein
MVGAPQPTTKEDHRPSHPSYSMRANLRHTWYDGITHTHSGSRLPNRSAHIRQCLCRSRTRDAFPRRFMNGSRSGSAVRDIANTGCFLPHPSLSRCEQPFVLLVLCVVRSRIFLYFIFLYFSLRKLSLDNVSRERCFCGGPTLFLWKLCVRFQNRRVFPA